MFFHKTLVRSSKVSSDGKEVPRRLVFCCFALDEDVHHCQTIRLRYWTTFAEGNGLLAGCYIVDEFACFPYMSIIICIMYISKTYQDVVVWILNWFGCHNL